MASLSSKNATMRYVLFGATANLNVTAHDEGRGFNLDEIFFNSPGSVANYIFGTYSSKPTVLVATSTPVHTRSPGRLGRLDGRKLEWSTNAQDKPKVIENRP